MGKWVYTPKYKILNLMNTKRTSTIIISAHLCLVLKFEDFLNLGLFN